MYIFGGESRGAAKKAEGCGGCVPVDQKQSAEQIRGGG
eukprot:CAMPEP_0116988300 /NCGR_PEP_ID=MMETSP0467-20121206/64068_1 /TAXON_ID=283647 /ORGANISM="Mesodinium pulex, Strain SPMC105" /LENGTH=37 /DNA_ID= /DNA_START= /DNA_END= /DNA_ORIENTATION=